VVARIVNYRVAGRACRAGNSEKKRAGKNNKLEMIDVVEKMSYIRYNKPVAR
jgi:hypothetical protein